MRFPGTGEGVARLVLVSIVKVDMARPSNGAALTPPVALFRMHNGWNSAVVRNVPRSSATGTSPSCLEIDDDF
jgi:hypothetical protein